MKKRTLVWLILALVVFGGGAWMAQKTNLFGGVFLTTQIPTTSRVLVERSN